MLFTRVSTIFVSLSILSFKADAKVYDWNGFIAQGLIQSENSNFINESGDVSLRLTEVGLNGFYRLSPSLRVAGQIVYLNGANRYPEGERVDYLFLDWQLPELNNWQLNLHLGRSKNYHWLYSATRDVPHTRPSIVLPQSIYFDTFRDVALGSDGFSLLASSINQYGEWDIAWSYGKSDISQEQTRNLFSRAAMGLLEQDHDHQLKVMWQPQFAQFQLGVNLLDSEFVYKASDPDIFIDGTATSQRLMLLFRYFGEKFEINAEIMRERVVYEDIFFTGFESGLTAEGGYLQSVYQLSEELSLLTRLDIYDRDREDRDGEKYSASVGGEVPGYFTFSDQFTLGVTWQPLANWQLQAEFHRNKGAGRLAPVLDPDIGINPKYWNLWAIQISHWF